MRKRRLERLEERVDTLPKDGPSGVIIYDSEEDKREKLKAFRDERGEEATAVLIPDNGRDGYT